MLSPKHIYVVDEIFRDITTFGSLFFALVLAGVLLILGQFALLWKLVVGVIFTFTVTLLIRLCYFKKRPEAQAYHNLFGKIDASSFPSLHTARVVFMALTFGFFFHQLLASILLVLLAGLVVYSRIYLHKHDWIDILGGAVLGVMTYGIVTYFLAGVILTIINFFF